MRLVKFLGFTQDIYKRRKSALGYRLIIWQKIIGGEVKNMDRKNTKKYKWFRLDHLPEKITEL